MPERKKTLIHVLILLFVSFLSINFVSTMGLLNYKTAVIRLKERVISRLEKETVTSLEASIHSGKDFNNYYGMETVFSDFNKLIPGTTTFVISADGDLLYYPEGSEDPINSLLASGKFQREFPGFSPKTGGNVKAGSNHGVFYPIRHDETLLGYFGCVYNEKILNPGFTNLLIQIVALDLITMLCVSLAAILFAMVSGKRKGNKKSRAKNTQTKMIYLLIMAAGLLFLSFISLYLYQKDYRSKMTDHISEAVKLGEESDAAGDQFTTDEDSGTAIDLDAEQLEKGMHKEMNRITVVLLSTMIILLVFAFELNNLVDLLEAGFLARLEEEDSFSEEQISLSLRFTGFLFATAEYMCVPYAAMMIRASGQSLFGLSVGMTAALPLTIEQFILMLAMFIMPGIVKKMDIKKVLVFSSILMIACNVVSFLSGDAMTIIICRAVAGIAYCGFKQVSNYLITKGYKTDEGRSENISQDNAGLLAGSTCGAGLGAILSANSGYASTFLFSAVFIVFYLLVTFFLLPWKELALVTVQEKERKPIRAGSIIRMFLSPEMLFYIIFIGLPLNIGVMLCVTLIPAVCQTHGISSIMLSYCYIANGLAGIYIGPALVSKAKARFGLTPCITFAFALTAFGIFILHIPPVIIMIVITSLILGFLDGFGTPMVTDRFMSLNVVKNAVDESTSLVLNMVLTFVLLTFAPMVAELMILPGKGLFATPMMAGAIAYAAAAILLPFGSIQEVVNRLKHRGGKGGGSL